MTDKRSCIPQLSKKNVGLGIVFVVYMVETLIFARLYQNAHKGDPTAFSFNSDILVGQRRSASSQRHSLKRSLEEDLQRSRRVKDAFDELSALPDLKSAFKRLPAKSFNEDDYECKTAHYRFIDETIVTQPMRPSIEPVAPHIWRHLETYKLDGVLVDTVSCPEHEPISEFVGHYLNDTNAKIAVLTAEITRLAREITTLDIENSNGPAQKLDNGPGSAKADVDQVDLWSFGDFWYFSVMTQTTVGYGDILPNCTYVRMVVVAQVILGLFLVGFVLNFAFGSSSTRKNGEQ